MSQELGVDFGNGARRPSETGLQRTRLSLWQKAVLFSAAYFACAEGSTLLSAKGSPDLSFWLPSGLYVAVLLLNDYKLWPWLVLAATAANVPFDIRHGTPPVAICLFVFANTVEALLGAWLMRTFVARRPTIATLREFVGLLFFSGVVGTLLGGAIGATGQVLVGMSHSFVKSCGIWWGSTAMATLIVSPFILSWSAQWPDWRAMIGQPKKLLEAAVWLAGTIATIWGILVWGPGINAPTKAPFLVFLLWAGLRFGVRGAATANLMVALFAGFCVQHYLKGLTPPDLASRDYMLILQSSVVMATIFALVPAIILAQHEKTLEQLRKSEERFQLCVRGSTDGLWDWNVWSNEVFHADRISEVLGYSPGELPNKMNTFREHLHPDDKERALRAVEAHLDRRAPFDVDFRLRTKSGHYRWFRASRPGHLE